MPTKAAKRTVVNLKKLATLSLSALIFILISASTGRAVTVTSTAAGGNWNVGTTWEGGLVPAAGDDVIIVPGATVTVTESTHINSITFNNTAATARTLSVNAGVILNVTGAAGITLQNAAAANTVATITGSGTINCAAVLVGGTLTTLTGIQTTTLTSTISNLSVSGNLTIDGEDDGGNQNDALFLLGTGTVTVAGTVTLTSEDDGVGASGSGDATLDLDSVAGGTSGTLNVSGGTPFSVSGAGTETTDLNGATATVIYSGSVAQTILATTYTDLTLSGAGTKTVASATDVDNTATISSGTTLNMTAFLTVNDGTVVVNGTMDFTSTSGKLQESAGTSVLTMGPNGLIRTVDALGLGPVANASLEDDWTLTSLETNGTIEYYSSAAQTVTDRNYNNLTITNAGTKTLTQTASRTINGNLTINTSAPFTLAGAFGLSVKGNWSNSGSTFTHGAGGTVLFNGTTNQTIGGSSATTFLTLTIANTGSGDEVVSITSTALTTVSTALNINDGVFDQGASSSLRTNTVTIAANGTLRNFGTGALTLIGNVSNAGAVRYSSNGSPCGDTDNILIRSSVGGTQRTWSGLGSFQLTDVNLQDQAVGVPPAAIVIRSSSEPSISPNNTGWTFLGCSDLPVTDTFSGTYTWQPVLGGDWTVAANWDPDRLNPSTQDVLIFDAFGPTVTNVPTQEIARLRVINGATPKLEAGAANNTLTLSGKTGSDLEISSDGQLFLQNTNALKIVIASGSTANVDGQIVFEDAAHRLIGNAASSILFHGAADFTTEAGFTGNPFGSGVGAGNGVNNSVQFESGSQYKHNAGDSPFGAPGSGPVAVFQTGSFAEWLTNTGFQASGRTYATLVVGDGNSQVILSESGGTADFQFDNLTINSTPSLSSTLTYTGAGTSKVIIRGNILSNNPGSGSIQDITLTAGSIIEINKSGGGTVSFGNIDNTRGILFGSDVTLESGTTLALGRIVQMGSSANLTLTANGTITPNALAPGFIVGAIRKPVVPQDYVFPLGKLANPGYTPVTLSNATGGGDMTIWARNGTVAPVSDATSLDEYWTITLNSGALETNLQFKYLDADVDGTEANYRVIRVENGTALNFSLTNLDTVNNTASVTAIPHFSHWTLGEPVGPSAVKLKRFNAVSFSDGVELTWDSGFEVDNLGYHLYREQNGRRTRVTPSIVAGSALRVGPGSRMTAGNSYAWFDRQGTPDTTYQLEAIDLNGGRQWAGPISPYSGASDKASPRRARAKTFKDLATSSPVSSSTKGTADSGFSAIKTWPAAMAAPDATDLNFSSEDLSVQQAIAAGKAVKIEVRKSGWYRVSGSELVAAGYDQSSDARLLQLFVDGQEVPISLSTEGVRLKAGDTMEFYGVSLDTPTTDARIYWLITGDVPGKRMLARRGKVKPDDLEGSTLRSFDFTIERREKMIYVDNLLNGDAENIFGAPIFSDGIDQSLTINNLGNTSSQPQLEVALQGLTNQSHEVQLQVNGTIVGTMNFAGRQHAVETLAVDRSLLVEGANVVSLTSTNGDSDVSVIDWIRLTYPHHYKAENNSLRFTAPAGEVVRVEGFSSPNVRVIDVTDPNSPTQHSARATLKNGAYTVSVQTAGSGLRTLIAFTDDLSGHPASITQNQPSTWNAATNAADMVIITHRDFSQAIEPLANLRRSQGLVVAVVDVEDVYDEFSYGAHTPVALKAFLSSAASDWSRKPQYLLLVGDSSWDPRNYLDQGANDFVPTKLIDTEYMETGSDDWLADFNNNGLPGMAIGRLPGRTSAEVSQMVSKIMSYEQEREVNAPLRGAVLVADNGFESQSEQTERLLPPSVAVQRINRADVGNDDLARGQIITALNQGPLIVNFYGHGSVQVWTGEGLLDSDSASQLTNANRLSVFVMMTCLNGYANDAYIDSLAESALRAPNGGAVAVWASSGFTEPPPQFAMSSEFYRLLFSGPPVRLGEATRGAKAASNSLDVRRTWVLLGDPAMRIR